jgi:hypothetical protein
MTNGAQAMSGLASYVRGVLGIADELRGSLTAEDIERLHTHFKGTKLQPWLRWRIEHEGLVLAFVAATPAERKKLKKYEEHRLLLTLSGITLCEEGAAVIRAITSPQLMPGGTYRNTAAAAGESYGRIMAEDIPHWPFPSLISPFEDDYATE